MKTILVVALDLLREAASRKWLIALFLGITAFLATMGLSLQIEVVDGALAASRLFGEDMYIGEIKAADVILRPVFGAAAYVVFYGGLAFGILACADFAPSMLSPGRIEHLLSLPVRRWALLAGTFCGVVFIAVIAAVYAAGGFTLILALKTGVWSSKLVIAAMLAAIAFAAVYGAMLSAAMFVRSAALSALVGLIVFAGGIVAGYRDRLAPMFEAGFRREAFETLILFFPPVSSLADASALLAGSVLEDGSQIGRRLIGMGIFGLAALFVGVWRFERSDF